MKNQIFVDGQYDYDYDCIKKGKKEIHTLYYAPVEAWSETLHNQPVMIIEDTGEGFNIVTKIKYKEIDYLVADNLLLLLKIINSKTSIPSIHEIGTKKLL